MRFPHAFSRVVSWEGNSESDWLYFFEVPWTANHVSTRNSFAHGAHVAVSGVRSSYSSELQLVMSRAVLKIRLSRIYFRAKITSNNWHTTLKRSNKTTWCSNCQKGYKAPKGNVGDLTTQLTGLHITLVKIFQQIDVDLCWVGAKSWALRRVGSEKSGFATAEWMLRAAALRITRDPCSGEVGELEMGIYFDKAGLAPIFFKQIRLEDNLWWNMVEYILGCFCHVSLSILSLMPWDWCIFASCEVCDPPQRSNHLRGCTSPWLDNDPIARKLLEVVPSQSLTVRPWKVTFSLPTTIFQGRAVKLQGCILLRPLCFFAWCLCLDSVRWKRRFVVLDGWCTIFAAAFWRAGRVSGACFGCRLDIHQCTAATGCDNVSQLFGFFCWSKSCWMGAKSARKWLQNVKKQKKLELCWLDLPFVWFWS